MSDLLSIGRSGVLAYQGALATVGENVTNADTAGYSRRAVVLKEANSVGGAYTLNRTSSAFGGVQATQVSRVWDQYRAASAWSADSDAAAAGSRLQYLSSIESKLGDGDAGVGMKLTAVFTSANQLASDPGNASYRQTTIAAIEDAASAITRTGADLAKLGDTMRGQAGTLIEQANTQLAALAKVNIALHTAAPGAASRAQLEDQRDHLIGALAGSMALDVTIDADGAATLKLSDFGGPTLLSSQDSNPGFLTLQSGSDGRLSMAMVAGTTTVAASPTGGTLAGLLGASSTLAGRRQQVDALASQFATQLNTWQAGGKTPAGNAGAPLLGGTTAATLAVVTTDPAALAAASASGDNGNLLALASLRGDDGVEASWSGMVADQALMVATTTTESSAASARRDSAFASLDEVTGVDLDTEAADLLRYQQAYTASAKIIQTARENLQTILALF